jgi:hypothetical protein
MVALRALLHIGRRVSASDGWALVAQADPLDRRRQPAPVHRWDEINHPNITRYYRELVHRPSVARVVDEARPFRDLLPMAWPADVDVA